MVAQLGGREKYAIPRLLQQTGNLSGLYTDVWMPPKNPLSRISTKYSGRYNRELYNAKVKSCPWIHLGKNKRDVNGRSSLDNAFDRWVSKQVNPSSSHIFGYSYASLYAFEEAKKNGMKTILGQINPGPYEAEIVEEEFLKYGNGQFCPTIPNAAYWDTWRQEVEATDVVVVNSEWSKEALLQVGVPMHKLAVVPLVYDRGVQVDTPNKVYSKKNKLKLLYLGAVGIRKGFHYLKEAMRMLEHESVELHVVGRLNGPEKLLNDLPSNIVYHGGVTPLKVDQFFRMADVFVFPTLSDGFGLTQLEAQYHKLPIIASNNCAKVVEHNENGMLLDTVDAVSIVEAIQKVLKEPDLIELWSRNSVDMQRYSVESVSGKLNVL